MASFQDLRQRRRTSLQEASRRTATQRTPSPLRIPSQPTTGFAGSNAQRIAPQAPSAPQPTSFATVPTQPSGGDRTGINSRFTFTNSQPAPFTQFNSTTNFEGRPAPRTERELIGKTDRASLEEQTLAERQRRLSGPLGEILPISPNSPLTVRDIPLLEAGFNFEQILQGERDRQQGFNTLASSRSGIGQDALMQLITGRLAGRGTEQSQFAKDQIINEIRRRNTGLTNAVTQAVENAPQRNTEALEGAAISQGALAAQDVRQATRADLAARGLGHSGFAAPAVEEAAQRVGAETQGRLAEIAFERDRFNEESRRAAVQQALELEGLGSARRSQGIGQLLNFEQFQGEQLGALDQQLAAFGLEQEARRLATEQLLANVFLETEREPISLAALAAIPESGIGKRTV